MNSPAPRVAPLAGIRVVERSSGVAAAYAGRLLSALGADVLMIEDPEGSPLRREPPLLEHAGGIGATFAYLAAGKHSRVADLETESGRAVLHEALATADILIDDTPVALRMSGSLDSATLTERHPQLLQVSVLPFGATGPKAAWRAEEINLIHAAGEGFLLPNGLSHTLFPDRPPLMIYGHFAHYQGGAAAALGALAAYWARDVTGPQVIDVSIQDATVMVGAFAIQRLGDGSLEHRATRSFRYGGVFETRDGFIELLMLEDRQWHAFVEVMDSPSWATDAALSDPLERSRRGNAINEQVRTWMKARTSDDIVQRAQAAGVPAAAYRTPQQVLDGAHERSRRLFDRVSLPDGHQAQVMVAPFRFARSALTLGSGIPAIGQSSWPDATPAPDGSNRAAIETTP